MRSVTATQLQLGELDIADIKIDNRSRDDIPQLLRGLQYLYTDKTLRAEIFNVLEKLTPQETSAEHGRPGMTLWNILVMGALRLNLNCDYDRLLELVNQHKTIRQMLGHGLIDDDETYSLQTIRDNVQKFTPEVLDDINQIVVNAGQSLKKKKR
jgi:transposase, IS5 family